VLFKYKGLDSSGKIVNSKIEANSIQDAKNKLKSKKIIIFNISEVDDFLDQLLQFNKTSKISISKLSNLSRDISIYLQSGVSLLSSIKLLSTQYKGDKKLTTFFESLLNFIDEGKSFYQALELQTSIELPQFYKQSIKISENGGMLQEVLLELSIYLKEQDRINKQISSAMAYPAFIFVVAVVMVGFMLSFIVPRVTTIFTQYNQELPQITKIVIAMGDFFGSNFEILVITTIVLVFLFLLFLKKSDEFRYKFHFFLLHIPFLNKLIEFGELSRFAYINSILIRSGVPVVQAIKLGADILKNDVLKKVFVDASLKVVEGERLSNVLANHSAYKVDIAFVQAIAIGEETSQVSQILQNLSNLYNESNKDKITIFLALLEPLMMLFVGAIIGLIVMAMLLPIFTMNFN